MQKRKVREKSKKGEAKMNAMGEIINVVVVKNIFHILRYILISKQNMTEKHLKVRMRIKFRMGKVEVDLEKIF